ncbi:MAG: hypothetical protein ABIP20_00020, partial [Chthoniobacteraceae bacterium]
ATATALAVARDAETPVRSESKPGADKSTRATLDGIDLLPLLNRTPATTRGCRRVSINAGPEYS